LQTEALFLLETKVRAYTSHPGNSDQWRQRAAKHARELEAAKKKLGDTQAELDSPQDSLAMRQELAQTCHVANLAVRFWNVASECFNESTS
jgi:hypothetical protein